MGDKVTLGRVTGLFGVRGWVKVFSETDPREGIVGYEPVYLGRNGDWHKARIEDGQLQGKGVVLKFEGIDDRDVAAMLKGSEIAVERDQLERLPAGEYYWTDLVGLEVVNLEGVIFGLVGHLFETGANDVLVVKGERERLIPWIRDDVIRDVDLSAGRITVDWDEDFL